MHCICCGVEEIYAGMRKYFAKNVRGNRFNVECKLYQFYNFINNKIFKYSRKMARLEQNFRYRRNLIYGNIL